ncbi:hypothetical protein DH2020_032815 [Rehmannia glutinosa]|uniref:BHLH domain-containing protein n=1 Tax=Rehmannia glutinosa TaxID=99300 RepID=A0ABR0VEW6_REHGL
MDHNPNSSKAGRKSGEKNRRNQMKALYSKLNSLVPHQPPMEMVSLADQLEGAENYIKKLQQNLEEMKQKKNCLMELYSSNSSSKISINSNPGEPIKIPNIEIHVTGSALDVVLITGPDCQFMFTEIIRILHQEGAEVVNASYSVTDRSMIHTIHSKIGECALEYEAGRISERLRKFVYGVN